jgi:C_GCAxxG_C_C family probable redox protein
MTTKSDEAYASFMSGFSCSQAVLGSFAEGLGMDTTTAYKISCGFGAGVSRSGHICGAVSGAIMIIGLKYGKVAPKDNVARDKTYALSQEFIREFTRKNGSISCTDLLGYNLNNPDEYAQARDKKLFVTKCPALVRDAVAILESLVNRETDRQESR